jgi:uncharacterized protein DUF1016/di-heme oxidoreductase (putative peroxidase)
LRAIGGCCSILLASPSPAALRAEAAGGGPHGKLGRGFSERNIRQIRLFYLGWPNPQTVSAELVDAGIRQTPSARSVAWPRFPLPSSHYVRLLSVADPKAREYYEREALRGGWSARQLDRQIASLAYQRTRSARSSSPSNDESLPADAHVRDPFVLEFLNLKDEYSERTSRPRSSSVLNNSFWNSVAILRSSLDRSACGSEPIRTAPLWGLGQRLFFLHDGSATDLVQAINGHGGEARQVINNFNNTGPNFANRLSSTERQDLINFLRSL